MNSAVENKEKKKILKRKRIIESASQLFSRKSYHEVMMEDVAKLSSIAKGTVYTYFSSKEDLYFSIMKLRMEKLITSLKEKIKNEVNSINSLRSFIIHLYMFMMKYQDFFLMYRKESLKADHELCSELVAMEKDYRNLLCDIIRSGKNEELFRIIDEDLAVELVLGSIYGAVHRGIEKNFEDDRQSQERDKIFEFIINGIVNDFDKNMQPLKGKTIVLTRSADQMGESWERLEKLGAEVIPFPVLNIVPPENWQEFDEILRSGERIDYVVFTSANAVKMFMKRIGELSVNFKFTGVKIVAVGSKTAEEIKKYNISADIVPKEFSSPGILNELSSDGINGKVFFIPGSAIARDELPEGLRSSGAVVKTAPVYDVGIPSDDLLKPHIMKLNSSNPDLFIFTSPSAFENFLVILKINDPKEYFKNCIAAAIGPTTREAIEKRHVRIGIMPSEYSLDGLVEEVIKFFSAI